MATRILLSLVPKVDGKVAGLSSSVSILYQMGFSNKTFPHCRPLGHPLSNHPLSAHGVITEQLNNIKKGYSNTTAQWLQHLHTRTSVLYPPWPQILICCFPETHPNAKSVPIPNPEPLLVSGFSFEFHDWSIQVRKNILLDYFSTLI